MIEELSPARRRTVAEARRLFLERGIESTSLQNIADALGVTKAAVYHQFPSKGAIVEAVLEPIRARIAEFVVEAERAPTPAARFETAMGGLVELVVRHGDVAGMVGRELETAQLLHNDRGFSQLFARLDALLIGDADTREGRVLVALAAAGLASAGGHPSVTALEPDARREVLLAAMRRLLQPLID